MHFLFQLHMFLPIVMFSLMLHIFSAGRFGVFVVVVADALFSLRLIFYAGRFSAFFSFQMQALCLQLQFSWHGDLVIAMGDLVHAL